MAARGGGLRAGLGERGLGLSERGDVQVIGGFARIEVLLGHQLLGVKLLVAVVIELLLLEVRLGMIDVGGGCLLRCLVRGDVGFGGGDRFALRGDA